MSESRIDLLRGMVEKNPSDVRVRFFLASELFRTNDFAGAAVEFEAYLETAPADPGAARKSLGLCYERLGRTAEAATAYRRAIGEASGCGHSGLAEEIRWLLEDLES